MFRTLFLQGPLAKPYVEFVGVVPKRWFWEVGVRSVAYHHSFRSLTWSLHGYSSRAPSPHRRCSDTPETEGAHAGPMTMRFRAQLSEPTGPLLLQYEVLPLQLAE